MKSISYLITYISILLLLSSCSKEKSIAETYYNNPVKDSVKFGYRISTLHFTDFDNKETTINFELEPSNVYAWKSIVINYEKNNSIKKYLPVYDLSGNLTKLEEQDVVLPENIEISYTTISPPYVKLISALRFHRVSNPFALIFSYDSVKLSRIERRYFDPESGNIGGLIEAAIFCPDVDLGNCKNIEASVIYQYSTFFNNLYHSNELLPFILLLKNPQNSFIDNILPDLPLYFSKHYPSTISRSNPGTFDLGLNDKFYPTYFYFHKANSNLISGYNFSLR